MIGFAYDTGDSVNGIGTTVHSPLDEDSPGPCITGLIDLRKRPNVDDGLVIEDAVLPSALGGVLASALAIGDAADGKRAVGPHDGRRVSGATARRARRGPLERTQAYMVMSSDDCDGELVLEGDDVAV